jgi:antitoxin component YwqK of YwqJK toxin-antitoxin module
MTTELMQQFLITIFTMGIFNLFVQDKSKQDPYWEFEKGIHFRPKLNKGDFFKLTGFDFGWFILEPISKFIKDRDHEIEKGKSLSYGQKALYYWWYIDAQVTNGGFVQFYYNGYGDYVPTIIKSLEHIGDKKMSELIQRAENIYQKKKKLMNKAREKDLFGSDLYDRLKEMSALDDEYYKLNDKTMKKMEKYIRKNANEICLDEEGKEFNMKFSGECKTFYSENKIKEIFTLENGIINDEFKSFYESGRIKEEIQYSKGEQTGERVEYYENGNKKYTIRKNLQLNQFEHYWYYENGNSQKLEHRLLEKDERIGEYKEWYNNGQLTETGIYISAYERDGKWLEFYKDGRKKLESEFINGNFLIQNCWNEKGEQTLKDGTGLYVYDYSGWEGHLDHNEQEYKNYKRHGQQKTFSNGVLSLYQEMENGIENGFTRTYYKNGKIKEEKVYKEGKEISTKNFTMFDNPKVVTVIKCEMQDEWLINRDLEIADTYPIAINNVEISNAFIVDVSFYDGYSQDNDLNYNYFVTVDEKGNVLELNFLSASNGQITKEVESNILKLKFKPAMKNGKPIRSYIIVKHEFKLNER